MRIVDCAIALDGGTQIVTLETRSGERIAIGLDGRFDSPSCGKQLFIGDSPEGPDTWQLPIGDAEERKVIALLEDWLADTLGTDRRETLLQTDRAALKDQDLLDRMALDLLTEIRDRDI